MGARYTAKRTYRRRTYRKPYYRKRYNRKRYYRKRRLYSHPRTGLIGKTTAGFPDMMFAKLNYFEDNWDFGPGTGAASKYEYITANNPRDPYTKIGGKAAMYLQTYMSIYRYCRVQGVKITVTYNTISDTNRPILFAIIPSQWDASSILPVWAGGADDVVGFPKVKYILRNPGRIGKSMKQSRYFSIASILQMTKRQYNSQLPGKEYDLISNVDGTTDEPTKWALLTLMTIKTQGGADAIDVRGTVKVKFYCKFYYKHFKRELGTTLGEEEPLVDDLPFEIFTGDMNPDP